MNLDKKGTHPKVKRISSWLAVGVGGRNREIMKVLCWKLNWSSDLADIADSLHS